MTKQDKLEKALYIENPLAFWLRPDRADYDMPCWMIDDDYIDPDSVKPKNTYQSDIYETSISYEPSCDYKYSIDYMDIYKHDK